MEEEEVEVVEEGVADKMNVEMSLAELGEDDLKIEESIVPQNEGNQSIIKNAVSNVGELHIVEFDGFEHQTGEEENLKLKSLENFEAASEKEIEVYRTDLCDFSGNFLHHNDMPGGSQVSPDLSRDHLKMSATVSKNVEIVKKEILLKKVKT